jgi:phytanoyl-CoA hydroxylase
MSITRSLTDDQIMRYHRDGYVVVDDVFSRDELETMDRELDRLMAEGAGNDAHGKGWIMSLGLVSKATEAFCADDRILYLIAPIVEPGIAIYSAKLVTKEAHDDTVCHWHQDDAYYSKHSTSEKRMSVWIPLQDTQQEHGCLELIPGSQERGLQPTVFRKTGTCTLSMETEVDISERIYCPIQAGSMILFSALLWHSSVGNRTDQRRRAFIVSYQEATVEGGNGKQWKILRPASSAGALS